MTFRRLSIGMWMLNSMELCYVNCLYLVIVGQIYHQIETYSPAMYALPL